MEHRGCSSCKYQFADMCSEPCITCIQESYVVVGGIKQPSKWEDKNVEDNCD